MSPPPTRGEVWLADLDPVRNHEQAGVRSAVIISTEQLNRSRAGRVVMVPMTTGTRPSAWHVSVLPLDGGARLPSFVKCEDVRSISTERLIERWGILSSAALAEIAVRMRALLEL